MKRSDECCVRGGREECRHALVAHVRLEARGYRPKASSEDLDTLIDGGAALPPAWRAKPWTWLRPNPLPRRTSLLVKSGQASSTRRTKSSKSEAIVPFGLVCDDAVVVRRRDDQFDWFKRQKLGIKRL